MEHEDEYERVAGRMKAEALRHRTNAEPTLRISLATTRGIDAALEPFPAA